MSIIKARMKPLGRLVRKEFREPRISWRGLAATNPTTDSTDHTDWDRRNFGSRQQPSSAMAFYELKNAAAYISIQAKNLKKRR
jgi:hypothetical protein